MAQSNEREQFLFKILIVGDCSVGKSCLMRRFVDNEYDDAYVATIGVDFKIKTLLIDDMMIKLQIWDTAGQERFQSITQTYYRGCDGVFLVVDMTKVKTLRELPRTWMSEVTRYCGTTDKDDPKAPVMIVMANKCDLIKQRQITDGHLSGLLIPYFKTSAKNGNNVQEAFRKMARLILEKRTDYHIHLLKEENEKNGRFSSKVSLYRSSGGSKSIKLHSSYAEEEEEGEKDGGCSC